MCLAERRDLQEPGHASTTSDVGLLHIDGASLEHPPKIEDVIAVLAGGNVHSGGSAIANQAETIKIVGRDRLLEPAHFVFGEFFGA